MEKLNDFMMLFRFEPKANYQPTESDLANQKKTWGAWIGGIAAQAKLVSTHQLGFSGKQINANQSVTDGLYVAAQQIIGGNMVVKAKNMDEVEQMAKGCPILLMGGTVEIRNILPM